MPIVGKRKSNLDGSGGRQSPDHFWEVGQKQSRIDSDSVTGETVGIDRFAATRASRHDRTRRLPGRGLIVNASSTRDGLNKISKRHTSAFLAVYFGWTKNSIIKTEIKRSRIVILV